MKKSDLAALNLTDRKWVQWPCKFYFERDCPFKILFYGFPPTGTCEISSVDLGNIPSVCLSVSVCLSIFFTECDFPFGACRKCCRLVEDAQFWDSADDSDNVSIDERATE